MAVMEMSVLFVLGDGTGDGSGTASQLGEGFLPAVGGFLGDSNVEESAPAGLADQGGTGGQCPSGEPGIHEVDVQAGSHRDRAPIAVRIVADKGERHIGKGDHHTPLGHALAAEHLFAQLNGNQQVAELGAQHLHAQPLGGPIVHVAWWIGAA